jgi:hypothetical protein
MRHPALLAAALPALALVVGCAPQADPCRIVKAPDAALVQAARANPHVEMETPGQNDAECLLDVNTGTWVAELPETEGENDEG